MKNADRWKPSKFVLAKDGRLKVTGNKNEVKVSSRLMAARVALTYQKHLGHVKGRLIDLGCGKVPFYELYKNNITSCTCVDWSNSVHKNEFLDQECDLTKELPFESASYDTVILSDVLEHIPRPQILLGEISRILDKDGVLLMNVPFFYPLHERPYDYFRYSEFALKMFIEEAGMQVCVLEPLGGSFEVLTDFTAKHLRYIPLIGNPLASLIQSITFWFGNTAIGTKILLKSSQGYPYGYFLVAKKVSIVS
ncbi:MAG: class I SAM-dependent methyltransferase [Flavobacteriales bacterium]|nr:class I SAM-dependent methyltransferase [Flavobacteriales bacterium]